MESDGSRERTVSEVLQAIVQPPVWRSAGQLLVSRREGVWTGSGLARFITVDARTGDQTTHGTVALNGGRWDFVRKTQEIIYRGPEVAAGVQTLHAHSLLTGTEREFARFELPESTLTTFLVSPDGSRVAYQAATPRGPRSGILVPGSAPAEFPGGAANAIPIAWSNDGRYLLCDATRPVIVDVATGAMTPLLQTTQKIDWTGDGAWSSDGAFIFLTVRGHRDEWRYYPRVDGRRR
jgi:hypothetical protein